MQPWEILRDFGTYIFTWLGTYGAMLGSFDGIAIADYWLVRRTRLDLAAALYAGRSLFVCGRR